MSMATMPGDLPTSTPGRITGKTLAEILGALLPGHRRRQRRKAAANAATQAAAARENACAATRASFANAVAIRLDELLALGWTRLGLDPATRPIALVSPNGKAADDKTILPNDSDADACVVSIACRTATLVPATHTWTIARAIPEGHKRGPRGMGYPGLIVIKTDDEIAADAAGRAAGTRRTNVIRIPEHPLAPIPGPIVGTAPDDDPELDRRLLDTAWAIASRHAAATTLGLAVDQAANLADIQVDHVVGAVVGRDKLLKHVDRIRSGEGRGDPWHASSTPSQAIASLRETKVLIETLRGTKVRIETDERGIAAAILDPGELHIGTPGGRHDAVRLRHHGILKALIPGYTLPQTLLTAAIGQPLGTVIGLLGDPRLASLVDRPVKTIANSIVFGPWATNAPIAAFAAGINPSIENGLEITLQPRLVRIGDLA